MVVHATAPAPQRMRQEDCKCEDSLRSHREFKAGLRNIARLGSSQTNKQKVISSITEENKHIYQII
jgi:hypothetical protein